MNMNIKILSGILFLAIFASCAKENIDELAIKEVEAETEIIDCAMEVGIDQNAKEAELIATPDLGLAPYAYKWSTGETSNSIKNVSSGSYEVEVSDAKGCKTMKVMGWDISVDCEGHFSLLVSHNADEMTLTAGVESTLGYFLSWSSEETEETITVESGQSYTAEVINEVGCILTVTYDVL